MKLNKLFQMTAVLAVFFAFTACDDEFTEIGGEIINNPTDVELMEVEVNSASRKINSVQTNNLSSFFLGVQNHPKYGENVASVVTQLSLSTNQPQFGDNVEMDSVVMTIPYFATETTESTPTDPRYALDSLYGEGSFKLSVYETDYFLNDLDPDTNFQEAQRYYSDQQDRVEENLIDRPLFIEEEFEPSAMAYTNYEVGMNGANDTVVLPPALRVKLSEDFFKSKIIDKEGEEELLNNGNFREYFRSLLIKAESNASDGSQVLLNFAAQNANITIYYTYEVEAENEDGDAEITRRRGQYKLNFSGANRFNTYEGSFPEDVLQSIQGQSLSEGSENLYLKSQEGSMAVISLFPDETVLDRLKEEERLINEANLIFYVDQDQLAGGFEPERLYLYDIENNRILIDYQNDPTGNESIPGLSRTVFSAPLERDEDGNGVFYKLRITQHLTRILNGDIENVDLGLVIMANINDPNFSAVRNVEDVERVPRASLQVPHGTVLHGDESADEEKRLKLRIYYTDY